MKGTGRARILAITAIALLGAFLLTGCVYETYEETRYFTAAYQPGMSLYIKNSVGDIKISRWNQDQVYVAVDVRGAAETVAEAEQLVRATVIDLTESQGSLTMEGQRPTYSFNNGLSISYNIKIPAEYNGEIVSSTGDIEIEKINGTLYIDTSTGDVEIDSLTGTLAVETRTGDIEARKLVGDVQIDSRTGDVDIDYLQGKLGLETSTGDVKVGLEMLPGTSNRIITSTGDVELILTGHNSSEVEARTGTGSITVDKRGFVLEAQDEDKYISGYIGVRSSSLTISSKTGNINITGN